MRRAGVQRDFTSGHEGVEGVVAKVEGKVELLIVVQVQELGEDGGVQRDFTSGHEGVEGVVAKVEGKVELLLVAQVQELGEDGVVLLNRSV